MTDLTTETRFYRWARATDPGGANSTVEICAVAFNESYVLLSDNYSILINYGAYLIHYCLSQQIRINSML